jgi:hypothetical protein
LDRTDVGFIRQPLPHFVHIGLVCRRPPHFLAHVGMLMGSGGCYPVISSRQIVESFLIGR